MTIKQNQYKNITQKDRELIRYWIVKSLVKLQDEIQLSMNDSEVKTYYLDFLSNHIEHEISMLSMSSMSLKDMNKLSKLLTLNLTNPKPKKSKKK